MAIVHFSSTVYTNLIPTMFPNFGTQSLSNTVYLSGSASTFTYTPILSFYKGTPATFPAFTSSTTRSADLLMTMQLTASTIIQYTSANSVKIKCAISNVPGATASASGLATWFMLQNTNANSTVATDLTTRGAIIGTVGPVGSGADMEIADPNIVSGQQFRSLGFFMNFPYDLTF